MAIPPPPPGFRPITGATPPPPPPGFRPIDSARIGAPRNPRREDLSQRITSYYGGAVSPNSDAAINALVRARQAGDAEAERVIQGTLDRVVAGESDPTRGMGTLGRVAAGAGARVADVGLGARQIIGTAQPGEVEAKRATDAPLMNTAGGFLGGIGGDVAMAAIPVPGSTTVRGLGRGFQAVEAGARNMALAGLEPVADGESRAVNIGAAGVLSGVGSVGGAFTRRALSGTADPAMRQSLEFARRQGIPVYPAQATTSFPVRGVSAAVNQTFPFTGARGAADAQQSAFNRAISRSFGVEADSIDGSVIASARERFDRAYNDVFRGQPIVFDTSAASSLQRIVAEAREKLGPENAKAVDREAANLIRAFQSGSVAPSAYQDIRGELYEAALSENPRTGGFIRRLRSALDATASRSLPDDQARALYRKTNEEYGNFKIVDRALRRVAGASDNVNPADLWSIINTRGTRASPEMREFARLGSRVLKNNVPTSGTVERGAATATVAGLGQSMAGGGPLAFDIPTAAGVLGTGAIIGRGLNSATLGRMAGLGISPNTPQFNRFAELMAPYLTTQTGEAAFSNDYYMPPRN